MYADLIDFKDNITLIENSGIQFYDYEISVDWEATDDDDQSKLIKKFKLGYFTESEGHLVRMVPHKDTDTNTLYNPFEENPTFYESSDFSDNTVKTEISLQIFNGVWFPVPVFVDKKNRIGPKNWARCRIVEVDNPDEPQKKKYRVVFAYDTAVQQSDEFEYFAPTVNDVGGGLTFSLHWEKGGTELLKDSRNGQNWVLEWITSIFDDLAPKYIPRYRKSTDEFESAKTERKEHEAHYLNVIAFLGGVLGRSPNLPNGINGIEFISCSGDVHPYTDVSLVLDVGNSRSCGLLVEDDGEDSGRDDSSDTIPLQLRDFNAPENIYTEAFESRVEFQRANFDYDNKSARSGRPDAFIWPSLVRIGHEAAILSAHREGNEGVTGLTSPKRYLWKLDPQNNEWNFNNYSYQIPVKNEDGSIEYFKKDRTVYRAYARPVSDFLNSSGDALFSGEDDQNMLSKFSCKSTMTFFLMEVFLQAMLQMNSFSYRNKRRHSNHPRKLKAIILTFPPSMPEQEKEIYRICAYEALGVIWKCMGYDKYDGDDYAFKFNFRSHPEMMNPQVPQILLRWDEAMAGQIVYIYNETQKVFNGNCKQFLTSIRRNDNVERFAERKFLKEGSKKIDLVSSRIASIDIGGGTSDLVISDYYFRSDRTDLNGNIMTNKILHDGFRNAGDDMLLDIIKIEILKPLRDYIKDSLEKNNQQRNWDDKILTDILGHGSETLKGVKFEQTRQQVVQQIFMKIGYRLLAHLESLNHLPAGVTEAKVTGTVDDYIKGTETVNVSELKLYDQVPYGTPEECVLKHVNSRIQELIPEFDILKYQVNVDLLELNRRIQKGEGVNLIKSLNFLAAIVNAYHCDILLLTGRPTKIPGIRTHILNSVSLSPNRVISMHDYNCGSWYPLSREGQKIGDPKTTVAVGALLAFKRLSSRKMVNFHFIPNLPEQVSAVRFLGGMNEAAMMNDNERLYKFSNKSDITNENQLSDESLVMPEVNSNLTYADMDIHRIVSGEENSKKANIYTTLAKDIGYRQFDNENFPATLIYSIETYSKIEQIPQMQAASRLSFSFDDDIEKLKKMVKAEDKRKIIQESYDEYLKEKEQYDSIREKYESVDPASPNDAVLDSYKEQLLQDAANTAQQQVDAEFAQKKAGLFGFGKGKLEEEKKALQEKLYQQNISDIDSRLKAKSLELLDQADRDFAEAKKKVSKEIRKVIRENYEDIQEKLKKNLVVVQRLTDIERATFKIELDVNKDKYYIYGDVSKNSSLYDELGGKNASSTTERLLEDRLPELNVLTLSDLEPVTGDSVNINCFRLRFKTAHGSGEYWIDTGLIANEI